MQKKKEKILQNRYKIINLIKKGGMGATYKAEDTLMSNRIVAIKEMLDKFKNYKDKQWAITNFLSEIQVLKSLIHPNIPRVFDHFMENNSFYFVMEYIEGIDFSNLIKQRNAHLTEYEVVQLMYSITKALIYIHNLKPPLIHRDIKPSNILKRFSDERIFLIDFGIARVVPQKGKMIGTIGFCPPEQYSNTLYPSSDIYALGVTAFYLLTKQDPEKFNFNFPPILELRKDIDVQLANIIDKCIKYNYIERYQSAKQLLQDLEKLNFSFINQKEKEFELIKLSNKYRKEVLKPLLNSIKQKYKNELLTYDIPDNFDYLQFSIGFYIPNSLIIKFSSDNSKVEFFYKLNIMPEKKLGEIEIRNSINWQLKTQNIINNFIKLYEKNSL